MILNLYDGDLAHNCQCICKYESQCEGNTPKNNAADDDGKKDDTIEINSIKIWKENQSNNQKKQKTKATKSKRKIEYNVK